MQRVLALTKYNRLGASSRLRFLQYADLLEQKGISVEVRPLLRNRYLDILYTRGRRSKYEILLGAFNRLRHLSEVSKFDTVWLEGELLPWLPLSIERWLLRHAKHLVVDYDDPIYLRYKSTNLAASTVYSNKIEKIMRSAGAVVAANANLAEHARSCGAKNVRIVPTVVDLNRYRFTQKPDDERVPVIGWIGSPSTSDYLASIMPLLTQIANSGKARIVLIGAGQIPVDSMIEVVAWKEEREISQLDEFDIGIMPLSNDDWARGKSGYKMFQYMAMALPVIASPVGTPIDIIKSSGAGLLAFTPSDWSDKLEMLLCDRSMRDQMGRRGRELVEKKFNTSVMANDLAGILTAA